MAGIEINQILQGHVLDVLRTLESNSVNTCVTSPPYWMLRNYGTDDVDFTEVTFIPNFGLPAITVPAWTGQLGLELDPWMFIAHMVQIFREVRRVLRDDGTLWLNMGDCYYSGMNQPGGGNHNGKALRSGTPPKKPGGLDMKPKDLVGIPWMLAFALRSDGWYLRSDIIWAKPNPMPEPVSDRPTKAHEYIFLFSKSKQYHYDAKAIMTQYAEKTQTTFGCGVSGYGDANKKSVWTVAPHPFGGAHFATFPEELIVDCIKAGSPLGGLVLDPFMGAGTTALVAAKLGRNFLGAELKPEYIALSQERLKKELGLFSPF